MNETTFPDELIMNKILIFRDVKVMIECHLAELYGVITKRLNEQAIRNIKRLPEDFMFHLTDKEKEEVVAFCDHLERFKFSPNLPMHLPNMGPLCLQASCTATGQL